MPLIPIGYRQSEVHHDKLTNVIEKAPVKRAFSFTLCSPGWGKSAHLWAGYITTRFCDLSTARLKLVFRGIGWNSFPSSSDDNQISKSLPAPFSMPDNICFKFLTVITMLSLFSSSLISYTSDYRSGSHVFYATLVT